MDNTNTTNPHTHSEGGEHGSHESHKDHMEHQTAPENVSAADSSEVVGLGDPVKRRKLIKIGLIVGGVLVVLALLFSIKSLFFAAIVNGQPISRYAVISELERQDGKAVLENLVDKALINSEAEEKNITVTAEEVDAEMKKFEEQFSAGGQNLDTTLEAQNMTRDDLKEQILIRKQIEKLLGDRANVSDDELNAYIAQGEVTIPAGQEEQSRNEVRDFLRQQKLAEMSGELLNELHAKSKIYTFVEYRGGSAHSH